MKYFLISSNPSYPAPPKIINWFRALPHNLPKWILLEMEEKKDIIFMDVLSFPYFLVSEMIKEVIEIYDSTIEWKRVVLFERKYQQNQLYYLPILQEIERAKVEDQVIFKIGGETNQPIAIRLDLAESILRRDPWGISLSEQN